MKPILCLDFDGVLHSYTSRWQGAEIIPDAPTDGAMAFLHQAMMRFEVAIFSSRSHQVGGMEAMKSWLRVHLLNFYSDAEDFGVPLAQLVDETMAAIKFPLEKPPAMVTLDDRAITFTGVWPSVDALLAFKPWNKP